MKKRKIFNKKFKTCFFIASTLSVLLTTDININDLKIVTNKAKMGIEKIVENKDIDLSKPNTIFDILMIKPAKLKKAKEIVKAKDKEPVITKETEVPKNPKLETSKIIDFEELDVTKDIKDETIKEYINYFQEQQHDYSKDNINDNFNAVVDHIDCIEKSKGKVNIKNWDTYKTILDNSVNYAKKHKNYSNALPTYEKEKEDKEKGLIQEIDFSLNRAFNKFNSAQILSDDDVHTLKNISVVFGQVNFTNRDKFLEDNGSLNKLNSYKNFTASRYLKDDNVIVLDLEIIKKLRNNNTIPAFDEFLKNILVYELNNARKGSCECHNNKNFIKEDSFIIESSNASETKKISDNNLKGQYYNDKIGKYESLILMLGIGNDIEDYYKALNTSDETLFYKFCGVSNEKDMEKLHNIISSIDSVIKNGNKEEISDSYLLDVYDMSLKNLVRISNRKNISLRDTIKLYNIIKSNVLYFKLEAGDFDKDFIIQFDKSTKAFDDFILKHYEIRNRDLKSLLKETKTQANYLLNNKEDYIYKRSPILKDINFPKSKRNLVKKYKEISEEKALTYKPEY